MSKLAKNLQLATNVMKQVKAIALSSNDVIPKVEMPYFYVDEIHLYARKFGLPKLTRYTNYQTHLGYMRKLIATNQGLLGMQSPHTVGLLATALHGAGECHEMAVLTAFKLLEAGCSCYAASYVGKTNPDSPSRTYGHFIVLIGNVDTRHINSLDDFKKLAEDVVVLDPYLGYVGQAKSYVKDNKPYLDIFGFNKSLGNYNYFDVAELRQSAPMIMATAQQVSDSLAITQPKYQRHPEDMPAILKAKKEATSPQTKALPAMVTCPVRLFDLNHSQAQSHRITSAMSFDVVDENDGTKKHVEPFVKNSDYQRFFNEPLPSRCFEEGEVIFFEPKPY